MKRTVIYTLMALMLAVAGGGLAAQEGGSPGGFVLGGGIESGRQTFGNGFNLGGAVQAGYAFDIAGIPFEAGLKALVAHDFTELLTVEPGAFFRWYFLGLGEPEFCSLFAQADIGASIFIFDAASGKDFASTGSLTQAFFMGGLTAGARFRFGAFYVEPYARFSYPGLFSFGAGAGYLFGGAQ
jgi:hypothetical protein